MEMSRNVNANTKNTKDGKKRHARSLSNVRHSFMQPT